MKHFVSDTHWGHGAMLKYQRGHAFNSIQDMNESLISAWNEQVSPKDDVYHLGDVAFVSLEPLTHILKRLNGKIHVILGNHDAVIHKNRDTLIKSGMVSSVQDYKEVRHEGTHIVLSHYPMRTWNRSHYGAVHLYGHVHGRMPSFGRSFDVGVDSEDFTTDYRPVSADEVLERALAVPVGSSIKG